jgi:hypothetical protein
MEPRLSHENSRMVVIKVEIVWFERKLESEHRYHCHFDDEDMCNLLELKLVVYRFFRFASVPTLHDFQESNLHLIDLWLNAGCFCFQAAPLSGLIWTMTTREICACRSPKQRQSDRIQNPIFPPNLHCDQVES